MFPISSGAVQAYFGAIKGVLSGTVPQQFLGAVSLVMAMLVFAVALIILVSAFVYVFSWFERKFMARMQSRHGPTYVGRFGILQNLADLVKLISKENIVPDHACYRFYDHPTISE